MSVSVNGVDERYMEGGPADSVGCVVVVEFDTVGDVKSSSPNTLPLCAPGSVGVIVFDTDDDDMTGADIDADAADECGRSGSTGS